VYGVTVMMWPSLARSTPRCRFVPVSNVLMGCLAGFVLLLGIHLSVWHSPVGSISVCLCVCACARIFVVLVHHHGSGVRVDRPSVVIPFFRRAASAGHVHVSKRGGVNREWLVQSSEKDLRLPSPERAAFAGHVSSVQLAGDGLVSSDKDLSLPGPQRGGAMLDSLQDLTLHASQARDRDPHLHTLAAISNQYARFWPSSTPRSSLQKAASTPRSSLQKAASTPRSSLQKAAPAPDSAADLPSLRRSRQRERIEYIRSGSSHLNAERARAVESDASAPHLTGRAASSGEQLAQIASAGSDDSRRDNEVL